jgi:hypothetical protein
MGVTISEVESSNTWATEVKCDAQNGGNRRETERKRVGRGKELERYKSVYTNAMWATACVSQA